MLLNVHKIYRKRECYRKTHIFVGLLEKLLENGLVILHLNATVGWSSWDGNHGSWRVWRKTCLRSGCSPYGILLKTPHDFTKTKHKSAIGFETRRPFILLLPTTHVRSQIVASRSIVFISDDRKHDYDAVHQYMDLVAIHLQQKRPGA